MYQKIVLVQNEDKPEMFKLIKVEGQWKLTKKGVGREKDHLKILLFLSSEMVSILINRRV